MSKAKEVEMKSSYNHIKHLVGSSEEVKYKDIVRRQHLQWTEVGLGKHEANYLDGKQHHTRFDC
jgi:hypothetical protein